MGVVQTHYIIVGLRLPFPDEDEDEDEDEKWSGYSDNGYIDEIGHVKGISIISDGMNGEYFLIGRIISKGVAEHGDGLDLTDCSVTENMQTSIHFDLTKLGFDCAVSDIKAWALTHFH